MNLIYVGGALKIDKIREAAGRMSYIKLWWQFLATVTIRFKITNRDKMVTLLI